jgi:hypothetical protein
MTKPTTDELLAQLVDTVGALAQRLDKLEQSKDQVAAIAQKDQVPAPSASTYDSTLTYIISTMTSELNVGQEITDQVDKCEDGRFRLSEHKGKFMIFDDRTKPQVGDPIATMFDGDDLTLIAAGAGYTMTLADVREWIAQHPPIERKAHLVG